MKRSIALWLVVTLLLGAISLPTFAQTKITFATRVEREVYPQIVEAFNASHPDIQVELLRMETGGYGDKLLTMFATGVGPDVFFVFEGEIAKWIRLGVMANLDEFLAKDDELTKEALYPASFEPMMYQGSVYGLSEYVNANGLVWFNKTMYEEFGLESPLALEARGDWTMDEMRMHVRRLSRFAADGTRESLGLHIPNWWGPMFSFLYTNGFSVTDAQGNLAINSEQNMRAVDYLRQWVIEDRSTNAHEWPDEVAGLSQQRLGMVISGGWFTWLIDLIDPVEIDVVPIPVGITGGRAAFISNPAIAMNPDSQAKEAAWEFMKYILVGEGARIRAEYESDLPSAIALADLVTGSGPTWQRAMSASMQWAHSIPNALALRDSADGLAMDLLLYGSGLEQVWRGERAVGTVLDELQERLSAIEPFSGE